MKEKKGLLNFLFDFFGKIADLKSNYAKLKENPETNSQSCVLGKKSIKFTIIAIFCYALMFGLIILGIRMTKTALIIFGIIFIVFGGIGMLVPLENFILGLSASIKQLKLNKKSIGFIALGILIISIIAIVILSILIINKFVM